MPIASGLNKASAFSQLVGDRDLPIPSISISINVGQERSRPTLPIASGLNKASAFSQLVGDRDLRIPSINVGQERSRPTLPIASGLNKALFRNWQQCWVDVTQPTKQGDRFSQLVGDVTVRFD